MVTHQAVNNAVVEITQYMLNSVSQEGSWGTVDYTDWGPIISALNVEHLLRCGLSIEDTWTVQNDTYLYQCSIKKCLEYLSKQIHDDGSFGADFWDTCKLATIIVEQNLYSYFDYARIHSYILQFVHDGGLQIQANDYSQSAEWSGPGTYAACAYYLFCADEKDLANSVLSDVISLQQSDGSFVGKKTRTGDNVIHPIWHTAQMLRTILKSKFCYDADLVQKTTHWIKSIQGDNGEYDDFGQFVTYYTAYAALAYLSLPKRPQPNTDRSIGYLLRKTRNGKVDDFGGTIMTAQALSAYLNPNDLINVYQTIQISNAKKLLAENLQLKEEVRSLSEKIKEYDSKYADSDIILSKKDVWKLSLWFGFITLVLGIIAPALINIIVDLASNTAE
ncbi:MAG: hypothetical protein K6F76_03495 [Clostridiales bacterium]|nr:hypothetical protein [Clostridiales bacterium]